MRTSWAPACSATDKTGNATNINNGERMSSPAASPKEPAGHTNGCRAEALLWFWMAKLSRRLGGMNLPRGLPSELLDVASKLVVEARFASMTVASLIAEFRSFRDSMH